MSKQYYVFSDETGHWCDQKLYVRSWVIVSEDEYIRLKNKIKLLKQINNIGKEIKYSNGHDYTIFSDLDFWVYFTVTFCDDFTQRDFKLITHLNSQEEDLFLVRGKVIKDKILNTIKNSIFLNLYEYHHLENSIKFFKEFCPNKKILFLVDSPQCQNRDWQEMFSEISSPFGLKFVNKSEDFEGIQFADILAGNMKVILEKIGKGSEFNEFEKTLFSKFRQNSGPSKKYMNNPQIIFWDTKYESLTQSINKIKTEIKEEELKKKLF